MAKLKKQVLGKISGALGDIVFREVNGINVVGIRPSSFNAPTDPASVARRAKFTLSAKLAQAISAHQQIKNIWLQHAPSGLSAHNFLIKSNYLYVQPDDLSALTKLVPDAGFPVSANTNTTSSAGVQVTLNAIGENNLIDPVLEVNIQMFSVLFLSGAEDDSVGLYSLISSSSVVQPLSLTDPLTFNAPLIGNDELLYSKYQTHKAFVVLLTSDTSGNVIHYSNTLPL